VLPWFAVLMTAAGVILAGLAWYVARRRGSPAGISLAVILLSVAWWGLAYAVELSASEIATKSRWGDLKYVGVCTLAPAWLVFVLQYTGRSQLVTGRVLVALAVEPVVILAVLFYPGTHDLVRFYPVDAAGDELPIVGTGPVFWVHLVYSNVMIVAATTTFVVTMVHLSRTYRQLALVMVGAALLPWAANLLHNFEVGWFARLDLTPFAFIVTGAVLVWGLLREGLVMLSPLARRVIVDNMADGVFVLDAFGRVADVNPAGARLLSAARADLIGRALADVLPRRGAGPTSDPEPGPGLPMETRVFQGDGQRTHDVRREPLTDRRGRPAGELVVLRDITERARAEQVLERLLAERSRVAAALQASLVPADLAVIPDSELATRYEPAGDGREIGGDFFDVFSLNDDTWGVVLGDVSGKGAEAAAVTAQTRYTLRTLADPRYEPSRTLHDLNARLLASTETERHCTLVFALIRPQAGSLEITLSLAGHHPPLLVRADGTAEPFGQLGSLLGLLEDTELHDCQTRLYPGDILCMFTDGLVEARNGLELFGSDRVAAMLAELRHLPAERLAAELVNAARHFHGQELADDLAVLVLKILPPGNGPDSLM
jgi:PAS domain S-box-containing protein